MNEQELLRNISKDLAVELQDDVDTNFRTKGFYGQPWAPRKWPDDGTLLVRSGALRSSLTYTPTATGVRVTSSVPYASIHNEGGTINRTIQVAITDKMRKFYWAKWYQTQDPKYRAMALTRKNQLNISQRITLPARPFVGDHPRLRATIRGIARQHVERYAQGILDHLKRR